MLTIVFSHQKYFINEHAIMYGVAQILRKFSFCTFRLGLSWNFSSAFLLSRRWMETDRLCCVCSRLSTRQRPSNPQTLNLTAVTRQSAKLPDTPCEGRQRRWPLLPNLSCSGTVLTVICTKTDVMDVYSRHLSFFVEMTWAVCMLTDLTESQRATTRDQTNLQQHRRWHLEEYLQPSLSHS